MRPVAGGLVYLAAAYKDHIGAANSLFSRSLQNYAVMAKPLPAGLIASVPINNLHIL